MFPYFPFESDTYSMSMGTRPLNGAPIIEIDHLYYDEIALKHAILAERPDFYFQAQPMSRLGQWEAALLLMEDLATNYPQQFSLERDGTPWHWHNRLLNIHTTIDSTDPATLGDAPLDWIGRQVQEDLLLLDGNAEGVPLIAGQLCFANGWDLSQKIGQSFLEIHQPVPIFAEQIGQASQMLMERIKVGRPVWRVNWAIKAVALLNLPPHINRSLAHLKHTITPENALQRCMLRVERQALARLPQSNAVLFTIHTYQTPIAALEPDQQTRLLNVVRTTPAEVLDYKGIAPFAEAIKRSNVQTFKRSSGERPSNE